MFDSRLVTMMLTVAAAVVFSTGATAFAATPALEKQLCGDGHVVTVNLVSVYSGRCVDVAHASTADGAKVQQWACHKGGNQRFSIWGAHVAPTGVPTHVVMPSHSHKRLEIAGGSTQSGAQLQQQSKTGGLHQELAFVPARAATTAPRASARQPVRGQAVRPPRVNPSRLSRVGHYNVLPYHSGLCLTVTGKDNGAAIVQAPCDGRPEQVWRVSSPVCTARVR